jgi:(p)ppGpp synthase/HD superfamily hydrolase
MRTQIEIAEDIAGCAHAGQYRRDGKTPYIEHVKAVAAAVSDAAKPAAWLHDVLEDSDYTSARLTGLGIECGVIKAVELLTRARNENYIDYIQRIAQNPIALEVKIADIRHNLSDDPKPESVDRYQPSLAFLEKEAARVKALEPKNETYLVVSFSAFSPGNIDVIKFATQEFATNAAETYTVTSGNRAYIIYGSILGYTQKAEPAADFIPTKQ